MCVCIECHQFPIEYKICQLYENGRKSRGRRVSGVVLKTQKVPIPSLPK